MTKEKIKKGVLVKCKSKDSKIVLSDGIIEIAYGTFRRCKNLTALTIPESVVKIHGGAFFGCSNLAEIHIAANNQAFVSEGGIIYNKDKTKIVRYMIGHSAADFEISHGIIKIGEYAFAGCKNLKRIDLPDEVISIGYEAFKGCSGLTKITLPASLEEIGSKAFAGCSNLDVIVFGGTKAQWALINKRFEWYPSGVSHTGRFTVYCTDGENYYSFD